MKFSSLILGLGLLPTVAAAQIPPATIPDGVGVNIHFVTGRTRDLNMIAEAGFKFIRMDFGWQDTEKKSGVYFWQYYDELTRNLDQRGIRPIYILDYVNELYEPVVDAKRAVGEPVPEKHIASPRHPESVAAFAHWAAEATRHYKGRHVIWEIYNEPNGDFWRPKPNAEEYTTMALATAKAIREAVPDATIVAPAMAGFDWNYMEVFLKSGVLEYLDGVSVHPYRAPNVPPETAAADYKKLRDMIDKFAPPAKRGKISILSGEWGYASSTKGVTLQTQADFAARQQLSNLLNGIPLSIWYDWKNDGKDPADGEQNFGTVTDNLEPKPAYVALKRMVAALAGYHFDKRAEGFAENDYVLIFANASGARKAAAWTLGEPHTVQFAGQSLDLGSSPQYVVAK